jgi:two-component system chemotaxis sensor kinase CheA
VLSTHGNCSLLENSDKRNELRQGISWLVVDPQDGTRAAIPLSSVARLEEIRAESIEKTGRQQVVQYRGEIMPLVSLNDFGQVEPDEHGSISLIVYNDGRRIIGVVVGRIVDIVSEPDQRFSDDNCETRIIAGKVTRIVHLELVAMNV